MPPILLFLAFPLILLLLVLLFAFYAYRVCFYAKANHQIDPYAIMKGKQYEAVSDRIYASARRMEAVPFEPVSITSHDGLTLAGRLYRNRISAPVEILFHGYRSCALRDCSGGHALA